MHTLLSVCTHSCNGDSPSHSKVGQQHLWQGHFSVMRVGVVCGGFDKQRHTTDQRRLIKRWMQAPQTNRYRNVTLFIKFVRPNTPSAMVRTFFAQQFNRLIANTIPSPYFNTQTRGCVAVVMCCYKMQVLAWRHNDTRYLVGTFLDGCSGCALWDIVFPRSTSNGPCDVKCFNVQSRLVRLKIDTKFQPILQRLIQPRHGLICIQQVPFVVAC